MIRLCLLLSFVICHLSLCGESHAASPLVLTDASTSYTTYPYLEVLPDTTGTLTYEQVAGSLSDAFLPVTAVDNPVLVEAAWMRLKLRNRSSRSTWVIRVLGGYDKADLYIPVGESGIRHDASGVTVPVSEWDYVNRKPTFKVALGDSTQTVYIRCTARHRFRIDLRTVRIIELTRFIKEDKEAQVGFGIFYGLLLVLILYNLFVFVSLRDVAYLYYVLVIGGMLFYFLLADGTGHEYLWPDILIGSFDGNVFAIGLVGLAIVQFARSILDTHRVLPGIDRVLSASHVYNVLSLFIPLFGLSSWFGHGAKFWISVYPPILLLFIFTTAVLAYRKGVRPARYYLLAMSALLAGAFIENLMVAGILPRNVFTLNALRIGFALEAILLSLALADRINVLREQKEEQERLTREADVRARASELESRVIEMDSAEDFESILSDISSNLSTAGIQFDTCSIEVLDRPITGLDYAHFETHGLHYADYAFDTNTGTFSRQDYHLTPPFTGVVRRSIRRFIDGSVWAEHFDDIGAILEIPVADLIRLRVVAKDRQSFTERERRTLEEYASAIALGYARFLDFREIQTQSSMKSAFLSSMSHELRTPMNIIDAYNTQVLERENGLSDRNHENLVKVGLATNHLLDMINDLLDLSKIESGEIEVNASEVDVAQLVHTAVATVSPLIQEGVDLRTEIGDVGTAFTDPQRLRQMLINLLSNAIKFTERGSVVVAVSSLGAEPVLSEVEGHLAQSANGEQLVVSVSDTGRGIPASEIPFLFDEYRQVAGTESGVQGGTGLGLSITKKFAELLGGSISVESELDKGSTFTISIPLTYTPKEAAA